MIYPSSVVEFIQFIKMKILANVHVHGMYSVPSPWAGALAHLWLRTQRGTAGPDRRLESLRHYSLRSMWCVAEVTCGWCAPIQAAGNLVTLYFAPSPGPSLRFLKYFWTADLKMTRWWSVFICHQYCSVKHSTCQLTIQGSSPGIQPTPCIWKSYGVHTHRSNHTVQCILRDLLSFDQCSGVNDKY